MPSPRDQVHRDGPERVPSYGHQFGDLHDAVVGDRSPDETFYSKISNAKKAEYICQSLRLSPGAFHLDLPLPLEDWAESDDMSLINAGLYFADLRRQFYDKLITANRELETSPAWSHHAEAEFWNHAFNALLAKRSSGRLLADPRMKH